MLESNW